MGWLKVDDKIPRNPKILAGDIETAWYFVCALTHCAEQLTDGYLARSAVPLIAPHITDPQAVSDRCVTLGLFRQTENGYIVEDFDLRRHADGMWISNAIAAVRPSWWQPSRPKLPNSLRAEIIERDGHQCRWCGSTENLEIDHIHPLSRGGAFDDPENLQVLCGTCNRSKGARVEV